MRLRLLLFALVFGAICFALGYLARRDTPPSRTTPTERAAERPAPRIQIDETKVELLPGSVLVIDAGPPPNVSSH